MLRRKPTALTISPEDLASFEEAHARKLALAQYRKTGEDPHGWFTGGEAAAQQQQQQYQTRASGQRENRMQGAVDPNDELKPLPGDKARIVRNREERIMGGTGTAREGGR